MIPGPRRRFSLSGKGMRSGVTPSRGADHRAAAGNDLADDRYS
ncbi:hypothetical protein AAFP35_01215 [Gordonia sp. CPCC 206044]